jgi:hypothetical protein
MPFSGRTREHEETTTTTASEAPGGAPRPRPRVRLPWRLKLPIAGGLVLVLILLAGRFSLLPGFDDIFGEETNDRTGPAVVEAIQDMSRYEAAAGNFQIVVDLEKDAKFLPDALKGSRTLYVGAGTVGAHVDLGKIDEDGVTVNTERTTATIRLPQAQLGKPALDEDRSYAVSKERGLLDRLGDFFSDNPGDEQAVRQLAVRYIADAAKETDLTGRAEKNTTSMLKGLLGSLGFEKVTVTYG